MYTFAPNTVIKSSELNANFTELSAYITAILAGTQALANPYKFSAYRNAGSLTINTGADTQITFDTEEFDSNNNFASSSYTAPVAGYYFFNARLGSPATASQTRFFCSLAVGGTAVKRGTDGQTGAAISGSAVSALLSLTAGQVVTLVGQPVGANTTVSNGQTLTYFQGFLVSNT